MEHRFSGRATDSDADELDAPTAGAVGASLGRLTAPASAAGVVRHAMSHARSGEECTLQRGSTAAGWSRCRSTAPQPARPLLRAADRPPPGGLHSVEFLWPGAWWVVALHAVAPQHRRPDLATALAGGSGQQPGLVWRLHPGYVLRPEDRVVLAATRRGLAELLGRGHARTPGV
ncbi:MULTISPECIES: hypothetical protein [unclassified Streptomyces]|uniref:hypothetical protein n=1 Tax=unclassified Streptomyces TaxID=2593676 RepID=UPI002E38099E|nr:MULTISPECIES: hypothetical protein [unclassified Streptomyces]